MNTTPATPPDCPFCRSNNLLKVPVLAEAGTAYLVEAHGSPGCYLILPANHAETPADIPDEWWRDVKEMLAKMPAPLDHYNLSFNIGKLAGQTVKHLHLWVIPRVAGQGAAGKGLATLISDANKE